MFSWLKRNNTLRRAGVAAAVCAVLVPAGAVNAQAAEPLPLVKRSEFCQVVLGPELDEDGSNVVLSRTCADLTTAEKLVVEALPFESAKRTLEAKPGVKIEANVQLDSSLQLKGSASLELKAAAGGTVTTMAVTGTIHLFTMYAGANWTGTAEAIYYSGSGTLDCNSSGYTYTASSYWRNNVTSFRQGHSSCNRMRIWTASTPVYYADINPTYSNLGAGGYNNNVSKVNVRHI